MKTVEERTVTAIMNMYDELDQRKYVGDYTALDYLDEFDEAVKDTEMTDKQSEVLALLLKGHSQTDVSDTLGIEYDSVRKIRSRLISKIAKQYRNGETK